MSARERLLHPAAWWLWGLGLATAASRTTNPMVLLLIIGVCILVVSERRDPSAPNSWPLSSSGRWSSCSASS